MCSVHSLFIKLLQKLRAALISQMPCGRSLGDASVITLRSRIYIKVTRMNIRGGGATMGSIGGYVFTTILLGHEIEGVELFHEAATEIESDTMLLTNSLQWV